MTVYLMARRVDSFATNEEGRTPTGQLRRSAERHKLMATIRKINN